MSSNEPVSSVSKLNLSNKILLQNKACFFVKAG